MKLKKENGYCGPYALKYISGATDKKILDLCFKNGFKQEWGMEDYEILRVLRKIGIKYKRVELKKIDLYSVKLRDFAKKKSSGVFLVYTNNHILCVANGVIVDPINDGYLGEERMVTGAWKIYYPQ